MPSWQPMDAIARPAYYDRDPVVIVPFFSAVYTPHPATIGATYTPAAGRSAFIEAAYGNNYLTLAPGTRVASICAMRYTPLGAATINIVTVWNTSAVINGFLAAQVTSFGFVAEGDRVDLISQGLDTGGQAQYYMAMKGIDFLK